MTNFIILQESISNGYRAESFFFLSLICIFFGISVIISKNPVLSVLFLIGLFFTLSIYLMMLGLYFIGLSCLLMYVGAISILFLFILMLINVRIKELLTEGRNNLPLALYNLPVLLVVGLVIIQYKLPISFISQQLECPGLIFLGAILLIIPNLLLRLNLMGKAPVITLKGFAIPFSFIFFIWLLNYLGYLSQESASNVSYVAALGDWEDIKSKIGEYFSSYPNEGQMATMGGLDCKGIEFEKDTSKLIPSIDFMDGSGSSKRPLPYSPEEEAGPSKRPNLTSSSQDTRSGLMSEQVTSLGLYDAPILTPYPYTVEQSIVLGAAVPAFLDGSDNLPVDIKDKSLGLPTIKQRYEFTKYYQGEKGFPLVTDKSGFQYIPCPKLVGINPIGFSGFISYTGQGDKLIIDKVTVWDPELVVARGWCSDGTQSNQPAARRLADLLLAKRANGTNNINKTILDSPAVDKFIKEAGGFTGKGIQNITDRLIMSLRLSK